MQDYNKHDHCQDEKDTAFGAPTATWSHSSYEPADELSPLLAGRSRSPKPFRSRILIVLVLGLLLAIVGSVALFHTHTHSRSIERQSLPRAPPAGYVPIWTTKPFEHGALKESISLPSVLEEANKTEIHSLLRSATVLPHKKTGVITVRAIFMLWADPLDSPIGEHTQPDSGSVEHESYAFTLSLHPDGTDGRPLAANLEHQNGTYLDFSVPSTAFPPSHIYTEKGIPAQLKVKRSSDVVATYDFVLVQEWEPYAKNRICATILPSDTSPLQYLEWRERQRKLGVDAVHWAARDAAEAEVKTYNMITKGHDTFSWFPHTGMQAGGDAWEGEMALEECYSRFQPTTECLASGEPDGFFELGF